MTNQTINTNLEDTLTPYLPPLNFVGPQTRGLVELLTRMLQKTQEPSLLLQFPVQAVIRLLIVDDNLTGICTPLMDNEFEVLPLVCKLARQLIPEKDELIAFISSLSQAMQHPDVRRHYPQIFLQPDFQSREETPVNILAGIHHDLANTPAYPHLAAELQDGLLQILPKYHWGSQETDLPALQSLRTGLVRVYKALTNDEAQNIKAALELDDLYTAQEFARQAGKRLTRIHAPTERLSQRTQQAYLWGFSQSVIFKGEVRRRISEVLEGGEFIGEDFYVDDDPPLEISPEIQQRLEKIERNERRAKQPDSSFDELVEMAVAADSRLQIPADERAVMQNYLNLLSWHSVSHPNEIVDLLKLILETEKRSAETQELRILFLSAIFTGRRLDWLCDVRRGSLPDADVPPPEYPLYDPRQDAIFYTPTSFADIAQPPHYRGELSIPTRKTWCLPLPEILIPQWRTLSAKREAEERIFTVTPERAKTILRGLSDQMQRSVPTAPAFTPGRLRGSFSALSVLKGGLDPVLAAIISDQRTLVPNAVLFYNTFSADQLAQRYRSAAANVWEYLQGLSDNLPYPPVIDAPDLHPIQPADLPEDYYMGSGYYPRPEVLKKALSTLVEEANRQENTDNERHNARTMLLVYLMSLLCGLRISEVSGLWIDQFDSLEIQTGIRLRLLHLPETRSSRYAAAARTIPIPEVLHQLLDELLDGLLDEILEDSAIPAAFTWINRRGQQTALTADRIRRALAEYKVPFPRWHAGRHLLRTSLLTQAMEYRATNAILGHTIEGQELFNPYLPGNILSYWLEYLEHAEKLAETLGIKELLK